MYNSDGYVLIDMSDVDLTRSSQNIPGIYNRVVEVIDTNKLALIINAGNNTPMAAIVHKKLNYYVINTTLFIFTINSNDIVIVEEAGEATVDVTIVPTLTEGTKIADFAIGSVEGSIYAPTQQSEINDNVTASNTTWSSDKIDTELSGKADSSDLATVATTGAYSDLTETPTIPVLTDLIDDSSTAVNKVWSSDKTAAEIAAGAGVTIDDTTTSTTKTWSSDKINSEISSKQNITDNSLTTTDKTIVGAINELHAINGYSYDAYDDTSTYAMGELVIYNNTLYKCTTAITTAEAWNANHWTATSIADEINRIDGKLIKKVSETVQLSQITFTQSSSGMYYYEKTLSIPDGSLIVSISCGNWGKLRATDIIEPYIAGSNKLGLMSNIDTFLNDAVIELIAIYI